MAQSLRSRVLLVAIAAFAVAVAFLPVTPADSVPPNDFTLTVLHHNDGESQLISAPGQPDFGGIARFKTLADSLKATADTGTDGDFVMLTSGDNFLAGPEYTASASTGFSPFYDAVGLAAVGYDAMVIGNHDFDFGPDVFEEFVKQVNATPTIPFLSANLDVSAEPGLVALTSPATSPPQIASSTIVVKDGRQIGIIGATTENLPFISSPRDVVVDLVKPAIEAEIASLTAAGAKIIILSAHLQGIEEDVELIAQLDGIDIAVAGGGDELLSNAGDLLVPGDTPDGRPYPFMAPDQSGDMIPIVTSAGDYKYIGRLVATFNDAGELLSIDDALSGPVRVSGIAPDAVAEDPTLKASVTEPVAAFVAGLDANVIATSEVDLDGRRSPGVRTKETNEGNLVADAFLWQANLLASDFGLGPVDVALANGGGIRNNSVLPAGDFTELDTFDILPFLNFLSVFETIDRDRFKLIMENAVSRVEGGSGTGRFAQISGFEMVYDPLGVPAEFATDGTTINPGSRVTSLILDDGTVIVEDGAVVPGPSISLTIVDFLARGGDQYPFGGLPFTNLGVTYQQSLFNYVTAPTSLGGLEGLISEAQYPEGGEGRILADLTIPQIQGAGHLSPVADQGQTIRTSGVVTAVAFNGYYLQDAVGDGEDATSDGIFVFSRGTKPDVGDELEIIGDVQEFIPGGAGTGNLSITQLSGSYSVVSSDNPAPEPVVIGTSGRVAPAVDVITKAERPVNLQEDPGVFNPDNDGIDFYESLEGMLVTVEDPVAVSATRTFNRFSSEVFTLTNNGEEIAPTDARTARGGINLQPDPDNDGDQNPERVQIQFDGTLYPAPVPSLTVGDLLEDVTGVVGYSFGNFEVNAIEPVEIASASDIDLDVTAINGSKKRVTVASYNLLNLSPDSSDDAQRATLAGHIVDNLGAPDVLAVQEIQDNSGEQDDGTTAADQTLQALVDAIVAAGGPTYEFFDVEPADGSSGGIPGGNIRNAFLYNSDRVALVGFESLTPDVLAGYGVSNPDAFDGTRDPLLATFKFSGKEFTVINNHLTSRFGSTPVFGGPQPFVQAGETEREAQVGALNEVTDALVAAGRGNANKASKAGRVIVLGDLNTFEFTNDLTEILPGTGSDQVLTNLVPRLSDDNVYTFNFEGNSQVLDHMFVTDNLLGGAMFDIVHVNVDFPRVDAAFGSDHEPLLASFQIKPERRGPRPR